MQKTLVAALCVTSVLLVHQAQAQRGPLPPPMVKEGVTEKISDHVYVIPDGSVSLVPNIAIIVGSRTTFVVDTGLGAKNAQAVLREVAKVSKNTDSALATTHFHPEHDLGAHAFPRTRRCTGRATNRPISTNRVRTSRSGSRVLAADG